KRNGFSRLLERRNVQEMLVNESSFTTWMKGPRAFRSLPYLLAPPIESHQDKGGSDQQAPVISAAIMHFYRRKNGIVLFCPVLFARRDLDLEIPAGVCCVTVPGVQR